MSYTWDDRKVLSLSLSLSCLVGNLQGMKMNAWENIEGILQKGRLRERPEKKIEWLQGRKRWKGVERRDREGLNKSYSTYSMPQGAQNIYKSLKNCIIILYIKPNSTLFIMYNPKKIHQQFLKGKKCNFIFNKLVICFLQRFFSHYLLFY